MKKLRIVGSENRKYKIEPATTAKELAVLVKERKVLREDAIEFLMKRRRKHLLRKAKGERKGFSWPSLVLLTDLLGMEKLGSVSREEMESFMEDHDFNSFEAGGSVE